MFCYKLYERLSYCKLHNQPYGLYFKVQFWVLVSGVVWGLKHVFFCLWNVNDVLVFQNNMSLDGKEDYSDLPPNQKKKKLQAKVLELSKQVSSYC